MDNHEEEHSVIGLAMRHVGALLAEQVGATHLDRYAAEVERRGAQRDVLAQLAGLYPGVAPEWLARRALGLPCDPPPPRACAHCGAPAGHGGRVCPTVLADAVLAADYAAELEVSHG